MEDEGIPSTTLREIAVLRQLRHPNIVELNDVVHSDGRLYLVFEFVDKDLKKYFEATDGPLDPQLIKSYTYQLLAGLEYCHVRGVMHRDLKPQNILVSRDGRLKIADFGLARLLDEGSLASTTCGTPGYVAPEVLQQKPYGKECDIWSIGVVAFILLSGTPPFYEEDNFALFE